MINSFFKTLVSNPPAQTYFSNYSSNKVLQKLNIKHRRYKLLSIILARATQRALKDYWEGLWHPDRKKNELLSRMMTLCDKNMTFSLYLGFDRLKMNTAQNKSKDKQLKNMINLLYRIQKYKLKQSFSRLQIYVSRSNNNILNNYFQQRGYNAIRKLHVLVKGRKKNTFNSIIAYAKFIKSYTKLRVISVIYNRFYRNIKQQVLAKLHRYVNSSNSKTHIHRQVRELKLQLKDINVQLMNKTESIQKLQEELNHIKVEQINFSYREPTQKLKKQSSGSFKSYSHKKMGLYDSSKSIHNHSNDNIFPADTSIRSILGTLNRSRAGSLSNFSNFDMITNCNCGYMSRSIKYKYLNQSLKNQLQIVKEELGVAKDLHEHFTNEIKEYLSGGTSENEYQKLKTDYKRIVQQRDQLRQKLFKYQKHIGILKSQFKVKMEQLYRKVRKDM